MHLSKVVSFCLVVFLFCLGSAANAQPNKISDKISDVITNNTCENMRSFELEEMTRQVTARVEAFNPRILVQDGQGRPTKMEGGGKFFEFTYNSEGKLDSTTMDGEVFRERISTDLKGNLVLRTFLQDGTELDPRVLAKINSASYKRVLETYVAQYPSMEPIDLVAFEVLKKRTLETKYAKEVETHRAKLDGVGNVSPSDVNQAKFNPGGDIIKPTPPRICLLKCDRDASNREITCQTVAEIGTTACEALPAAAAAACRIPFVQERGRCLQASNNRSFDCRVQCT
jgi:hypothetical protein